MIRSKHKSFICGGMFFFFNFIVLTASMEIENIYGMLAFIDAQLISDLIKSEICSALGIRSTRQRIVHTWEYTE